MQELQSDNHALMTRLDGNYYDTDLSILFLVPTGRFGVLQFVSLVS